MGYNYKTAEKVSDIPNTDHYAIIVNATVYENSGYGNDTGYHKNITEYRIYKNQETWEDDIKELASRYETYFKAIMVKVPKVETKITVSI